MGSTMRGTPNVVATAAALDFPLAFPFDFPVSAVALAAAGATAASVNEPIITTTIPSLRMRTSASQKEDCRIRGSRRSHSAVVAAAPSCRLLLVIVVEPAARLPPQQLSRHHAAEERAGRRGGVPELGVQRVEDGEAGVEPDQVEEGERPHREAAAALHG